MTLEEMLAFNREAEAVLAKRRAGAALGAQNLRYFGYLSVDIYDCPPFLMFTNDDSPVVRHILNHGIFEPFSMALWCRLSRLATGIVDVGANVGIYSLSAAKLRPELSIHAFEPNPYAFARLRIHKHINELDNLVEHAVGVGNANGMAKIGWYVKPGGNIASGAGLGGRGGRPFESFVAKFVTLNGTGLVDRLGKHALVKIDVEGAEALVCQGMSEVISRRPDIIVETFYDKPCRTLNNQLMPLGYEVYRIRESDRTLAPTEILYPADISSDDGLNYLVTARPREEIERIAGEAGGRIGEAAS